MLDEMTRQMLENLQYFGIIMKIFVKKKTVFHFMQVLYFFPNTYMPLVYIYINQSIH